ncbi:calcium-activated chloride channel protein (macronuclear) [Tetrahymena thermophila SB210]|uniref:Calcium-activated chloride channel protein n=1 Tax=Tetrahymena thermophila (strain SB210) TaxID=312017 RepID=I7M2D3_TETTS|nr:calcium-activated chloride channel protein [Tetrahymena thermophila SB210]EAR99889.2 calcium-activated chloride channel protein [Tetrahymena thermophila SB210]|eukprot:XP_001020134.2 calcium-activated chloride channel protein [Tetrahymena thermophila SB210]
MIKKNRVVPLTSEHNKLIAQNDSNKSSDDLTSANYNQIAKKDDIEEQQKVVAEKIKSMLLPPRSSQVNLPGQNEFDKDQIPPNLDIALKHQKASKVGPIDLLQMSSQDEKEGLCPCCTKTIYRSKLSLSSDNSQLSYLGAGFPLYFGFTKFSIFLTLMLFLTSGFFNLFTNIYYGDQCSNSYQAKQAVDYKYTCQSNWITILTVGNKKNETTLLQIQDILNMATVCVVVLCFQYFRYYIRKIDTVTDIIDISAEDYTMLVKEIPVIQNPTSGNYLEDLKIFLQQNLIENAYTSVSKINFSYNLVEFKAIQKKKDAIIQQKKAAVKYRYVHGEYQTGQSAYKLDKELEVMESELTSLSKKFYDSNDAEIFSSKFTGWAFVSLESAKEKDQIIDFYKPFHRILRFSKKLNYGGKQLQIQKPPAPSDVFWENLHIHSQNLRQIFMYIILVGLLTGCFFVVNQILKQQQTIKNNKTVYVYDTEVTLQIVGIVISVIINVMNLILKELCILFTNLEKQKTRSEYYISAIQKISLTQFTVSALIIFGNQMFYLDGGSYFQKIFDKGGLVYNIQYVFITSTIMGSFLQFLNIPGIFKAIKRYFAKNSCQNQTNYSTQQQLNQIFEDPEFDIILKYSRQLKTIFLMAFYAPIIPACLPWVALTLLLNYILDKYELVYRRIVKYNISNEITIEMTELLELAIIIFCAGNIFFSIFVIGNNNLGIDSIYQFIACGIGLINAVLPMQKINQKLFKVADAPPNEQSYFQIEDKFNTDYERENPATKQIAKQKFLDRLMQVKQKDDNKVQQNLRIPLSNLTNINEQSVDQPSTRRRRRQQNNPN